MAVATVHELLTGSYRQEADKEVLGNIGKLSEAFLECRTLGHTWKLTFLGPLHRADDSVRMKARASIYDPDGARITKCARCRTRRTDFFLFRFGKSLPSLLTRSYDYPDDYRVPGSGAYRGYLHDELFRRHWLDEGEEG